MAERVTIQDIADALHLSRNTVSRAINNTGNIAENTRMLILKKAAEMGYRSFSYLNASDFDKMGQAADPPSGSREIAFLTTRRMDSSHFASLMLDRIVQEFSQLHYSVTIHWLVAADIAACRLPAGITPDRTGGIICAEMFDRNYCRMLTQTDYPLLFVDFPVFPDMNAPVADILLMENTHCIESFILEMKRRGVQRFGFCGDIMNCRSFMERYWSFRNALHFYGLEDSSENCLTDNLPSRQETTYEDYIKALKDRLRSLHPLPEVFVCTNDFMALDLLHACRQIGLAVPDDIMLFGFDDSSESRYVTPSLSTVHIHTQAMGHAAVELLLSRIRQPEICARTVHVESTLVLRESTGGI